MREAAPIRNKENYNKTIEFSGDDRSDRLALYLGAACAVRVLQ